MSVYDLTGRKALVTGGARGLGAGMAEALARAGAAVVIGDIREELGEATVDAIKKAGGDAAFLPLNVTDDHSWERAIEGTIAELGGLDIVVNNAGVEISSLVVDLDPDDIRKMLEVNILGTSLGIKHAFRAMRPGGPAGRGGAVVNIASVAATIAFPGIAVYSATKFRGRPADPGGRHGIRQARLRRAGELHLPGSGPDRDGQPARPGHGDARPVPERGGGVGAVVGLTPHGRLGEVADMADAVVFLASDAARFITGAGLPVDGGMGM